jgi:molybdopterin-dependent oxidoreductase alpha subunit
MRTRQNNISENTSDPVHAGNPEKFTGLKLHLPDTVAAGWPAIFSSARHLLHAMGPFRAFRAMNALNQMHGYDCPGCAWPDPDTERSRLGEYCENGAKAIAEEATDHKLTGEFFSKNSVAALSAWSDYEIGKKGRVAEPVYLAPGETHYRPVSWEQTFEIIAAELNKCASPDEAVFYTSGRTSNEAAFLYQLFVRQFGTNNLPDCSNMCHESSGVALTESLGMGKGSVTLTDFYKAEVIIILGQNPGTNHPRMLTALQKAKENGCIIIAVNPLPEPGLLAFNNPQTVKGLLGMQAKLTDIFAQVKINGDMAFLQALGKLLIEADEASGGNVLDHDFIQSHTAGFDLYKNHLGKIPLEKLSKACGISEGKLKEIAGLLTRKHRIIACWAMGLTQHKNAVDTIREIVNLLLIKGSIGKEGAGTCPVRGHSNVQGDRTMGIYEKPSPEFIDRLSEVYGREFPRKRGYDTVDSIVAMHENKVRVFVGMGGNFLSATPDTNYTAEALRRCELTVHISTKLNRSHLVTGKAALILPALARSDRDLLNGREQLVSTENSMGVIQQSIGNLSPLSDRMLSEPVIVCRMARAVFGETAGAHWDRYLEHYDNIRDDIARVIPGFSDYNTRVRKAGGFYLPNPNREKVFTTDTSKAIFNIAEASPPVLAGDEYLLMTVRSHDQFNTTIYGLNDRYRGVINERRVVFMNRNDMQQAGFKAEEVVDLFNDHGGRVRVARKFIVIPYPIPEKCLAAYFPETNVLVPIDSTAGKSNTPTSKSIIVKIRKNTGTEP